MAKGKGLESLRDHPLYGQIEKEDEKVDYKKDNKGGYKGDNFNKNSNNNFNKQNNYQSSNQPTNPTYEAMMNAIKDKNNTLKDVFVPVKYALPNGYADETAKLITTDTNNNQIRKIFESIKSIDMKIKNKPESYEKLLDEIYLLMPSIAYAKNRKLIKYEFYDIFKECIRKEKLQTKEDFYSFAKFMEAVVAYSKK